MSAEGDAPDAGAPEIEVTPAMVEAGAEELMARWGEIAYASTHLRYREAATAILSAMLAKAART